MAAPAAHAADLHLRSVQARQHQLGREIAEFQRLAQRQCARRRDALVQYSDLTRQRHAHRTEDEQPDPEHDLRGHQETHSKAPVRGGVSDMA